MILSAQNEPMSSRFGMEKGIKMLKDAGFDAFDASLIRDTIGNEIFINSDNWRENAVKLREYTDSIGILCNQAHAPFPSSTGDTLRDEEIYADIVRAMEVASILGAKIIIVHPKKHLHYHDHIKELREMNISFYKSLIPYCKKFGIKVAIENMWCKELSSNNIIESTCSRCDTFCDYIDAINSEWIVACLDIGHVPLVGESLTNIIHALGDRLKALHVHDNEFISDMHTLPFISNIDFKKVCRALGEINYSGDFTYEIDAFFRKIPDALVASALNFAHDTGRYLINTILENK